MKVFVVFALFVVASNAALECDEDDKFPSLLMKPILKGTKKLFKNTQCKHIGKLFFKDNCLNLVNAGFCYYKHAKNHYAGSVNYGVIANDMDNLKMLGEVSCDNTRACYEGLSDALSKCYNEDKKFLKKVRANAQDMSSEYNIDDLVQELIESHEGTLLGELIAMVWAKVQKFKDADLEEMIINYIEEHPDVVESAQEYYAKVDDAAVAWCDSACFEHSGDYLKLLFSHMNAGGSCPNLAVYCEDCKASADAYLGANNIPCCLEDLIESAKSTAASVREDYGNLIEEYINSIQADLSAESIAEGEAIKALILPELICLKESYDALENCESA